MSFCLLALSLAGCGKADPGLVEPEVSVRRIDFPTPLVSAATRAATDNVDYPETSTFGVFGLYYRDGDFTGWESSGASLYIPGAEFKFDKSVDDSSEGTGAWISKPEYYWLKSGKMTFAAWSPYRAKYAGTLTYGATGLKIDNFNSGANGDMDLMYSERVYDKSSSDGENAKYDGIDIVFHHALAGLKFKTASDFSSQASTQPAKVTVSRILIWGLYRQGNFNEGVDETTNPSQYTSSPKWKGLSSDYTYTKDDPLVVSGTDLETFIIPQEISENAVLKVYYSVQVGNSNPVPAVSPEISLAGNKRKDNDSEIKKWDMATRYVYTLTFSNVYPIKFSVDVYSWEGGLD